MTTPHSCTDQLHKLELVGLKLAALERELPTVLITMPANSAAGETVPTGIRKLGLAHVGLAPPS